GADVDVETDIGERPRDNLCAAIVAILAYFRDQDARTPAFALSKLGRSPASVFEGFMSGRPPGIRAPDYLASRAVSSTVLFHRIRNFAQGRAAARRFHGNLQKIALSGPGAPRHRLQGIAHRCLIPRALDGTKPLDLLVPHGCVVDLTNVELLGARFPISVHPADHILAGIDAGLLSSSRFLDASHRQPSLDGVRHSTQLLDLIDQLERPSRETIGEHLNVI